LKLGRGIVANAILVTQIAVYAASFLDITPAIVKTYSGRVKRTYG
jgi:hypothetical protein